MDKQKKIVLQYIIPAGTLVLFIGIITLKNFIFPEKVKVNREITMDIPDVNKKIEENKNIAYEQEREYHRGDRTTDFPILPDDSVMTVENPLKVVPLIHSNLTPVKFSHSPFCLFLFSSYSSCPLCRVLH